MANIECWIGSFVILRGSGPVLLKLRNTIFLYFFRGVGGRDPLSPPLVPHMFCARGCLYLTQRWLTASTRR